MAYENSGGGGADPYTSIADTAGNTWTVRQSLPYDPGAAGAGVDTRIFTTSQNVATLTTADTITMTCSNAGVWSWTLHEWTGSVGTADYLSGGVGTGATTGTPTVTTSSITNGDAVVGVIGMNAFNALNDDTDTTNGSWTASVEGYTTGPTGGWLAYHQTKVVTGTGTQTYNPTFTSAPCGIAWISVQETAAAGGRVPRRSQFPQLIAQ